MRKDTKNTILFGIRVLLNDGWMRKSDILCELAGPCKKEQKLHAKLIHGNEDADPNVRKDGVAASLELAQNMASGKALWVCDEILHALHDQGAVQRMGFALSLADLGGDNMAADDLEEALRHEMRYMTSAVMFGLGLVGRRALGHMEYLMGFPGRESCSIAVRQR